MFPTFPVTVPSRSVTVFLGYKLETPGLTRFLCWLFCRKKAVFFQFSGQSSFNSPGSTLHGFQIVLAMSPSINIFSRNAISNSRTIAMGSAPHPATKPGAPKYCFCMHKPSTRQSTKMHKTYLKNGENRGDTQERYKGAGHLLNCCRAHWVMVLCTYACRMRALVHLLLYDLKRDRKFEDLGVHTVWTCKTASKPKPSCLILFEPFGSFWWFCTLLISISNAAEGNQISSHKGNYPRTDKSRPDSNSMSYKIIIFPIK